MNKICGFQVAWQNPCKNETPCDEHKDEKCCVCGKPAVKECPATFGFVCGANLCNSCEHQLTEKGVNSFGGHCRKGEQKHESWYVQDYIEKEGLTVLDNEWWSFPYVFKGE